MMLRPPALTTWLLGLAAAGLLAALFVWSGPDDGRTARATAVQRAEPPARPTDCRTVRPGDTLGDAIADAPPGATLCLQPGSYRGPVRIDTPLTIWGPPSARLESAGNGSTIFVAADDVHLAGFTIAGSGQRYVDQDAGIFISKARGVVIDGLDIDDVLFGITSQQVDDLTIRDTSIRCRAKRALGMRGDGIRLWETRHSRIADNQLEACRDLVVWYSPDNLITGNRVSGGRYGTHFMYSSRNLVTDNQYVGNVVGIFVMYSRHLLIDSNILADAAGSAGVGLGLKESGNLEITRNRFLHNTVGSYVDTSPLHREDRNLYALNEFRLGNAGVVFHSSPRATGFRANTFKDNLATVEVEGGGDATDILWSGNYFGGYGGYDLDRDGVGDVPFELRTATGMLRSRYPQLDLFHGSLAMFAIETASRVSPLYAPDLVLSDDRPRMHHLPRTGATPSWRREGATPSPASTRSDGIPAVEHEFDATYRAIRADHRVLTIDRSDGRPTVYGAGDAPPDQHDRY